MKHEFGEKPTPEHSLSTLSLNSLTFPSKSFSYKGKHKKCVKRKFCLADSAISSMRRLASSIFSLRPVITAK